MLIIHQHGNEIYQYYDMNKQWHVENLDSTKKKNTHGIHSGKILTKRVQKGWSTYLAR